MIHTYLPNVQVLTRIDSRRVIRIVRNLLAMDDELNEKKNTDILKQYYAASLPVLQSNFYLPSVFVPDFHSA